jgi:hypothetical protein
MRIEYVRIKNYKCFRDTGKVPLANHVSVIVGQNNAGKTAFLEALRPEHLVNKPHQEPAPRNAVFPQVLSPTSEIEFGISISGEELEWRILSTGVTVYISASGGDWRTVRTRAESLLAEPQLSFVFLKTANNWNCFWFERRLFNSHYHQAIYRQAENKN